MYVLGAWRNFLDRKTAESVLHHLVFVVEVTRSGNFSQTGQYFGVAPLSEERSVCRERRGIHTPHRLTAQQASGDFVRHVGDERARQSSFVVAFCAVVEHRASGMQCGRCVRDVVGEHLLCVWTAERGEVACRLADDVGDDFDDSRCCGEIWRGRHGANASDHGFAMPYPRWDWRPTMKRWRERAACDRR